MAYDAVRLNVVLFGGVGGSGPLGDTWTWDGCWTKQNPATSPPGRSLGKLVFDAARGNVVLFGGGAANADPFRNDTWTWNGVTWTQHHPTSSPPPVDAQNYQMTYDPANGTVVLAGQGGGVPFTWTWDGSNWTERHSPTWPPTRFDAGLTVDARSRVLLFGGNRGQGGPRNARNDTWIWNGTAWSQLSPPSKPQGGPARMAYDEARRQVVLFEFDGTWTWDGTTWTQQHPSETPEWKNFMAMAYDGARERVVLFGGKFPLGPGFATGETWTWDGSTWRRA